MYGMYNSITYIIYYFKNLLYYLIHGLELECIRTQNTGERNLPQIYMHL